MAHGPRAAHHGSMISQKLVNIPDSNFMMILDKSTVDHVISDQIWQKYEGWISGQRDQKWVSATP